ncbi:MAG TPA: alpha-hydroxy acid oxidase [Gemmatimonadaceae bacterium]|nr:alpha-hydroxy acid oxidase [Gemmatimonadaceae bacterium]
MINLFDYEREAEQRIPPAHWGYIAGGANDEVTVGANRAAFDRILIRYRTMVDVTSRNLSTTVLGVPVSFPVLVAPTAMQKLAHVDGECATARATRAAGTLMVTSTTATTRLSDVIAASPGPMWFQLYLYQDRGKSKALIEEAVRAGYTGVMLTVDAPLLGRRERDIRSAFTLPSHLTIANAADAGMAIVPAASTEASGLMLHFRSLHDAALVPKDIAWVREVSGLPVIVKGIVRGDDAARAVEHGADAIVVSNHGGRQLDTSIPSIMALPEVADTVGGRAEVYVDGGIRRGTDVMKALALGARAVLVGRPVLWGLAVDGETGVRAVLELLRQEIDLAMGLSGTRDVSEITRDLVVVS